VASSLLAHQMTQTQIHWPLKDFVAFGLTYAPLDRQK